MLEEQKDLIKNKDFIYLWNSQILSQVTINLLNFLLLIKLFESTGSSIATSLLWISYALPALIIGPFAAASTDMIDRRKILIYTNLFQSFTVLAYALASTVSIFIIYGVAMVYSFFNQFYVPSELATLPSIVTRKNLATANGLFFLTQQVSIVIGFGVAGILNQYVGFSNSLYLSSFLLFLAFLSVLNLPNMSPVKSKNEGFEDSIMGFFKRIIEGYQFIKKNKNILAPFLLLLVLYVSLSISTVNIPFMAESIFMIPVNMAGLLLAVPAGAGAVTTALLLPRVLKKGHRKMTVIEISLMVLTVSLLSLFMIGNIIKGTAAIILGIVTVYSIGLSFVGLMIPTQTYLQEEVPGSMRGRVFGNYWFLATAATIFPVIFSGTVVEILGIRTLIFILFLFSLSILIIIKAAGKNYIGNGFSLKNIF